CYMPGTDIVLATSLSGTSTITNPVYYWYDESGSSVSGGSTGSLNLGELSPGTYTYSVGVSGDGVCESLASERKTLTFTINPRGTASDIQVDDQTICFGSDAVLMPTAPSITNPVFMWYASNDMSSPIMDGDTNGSITYSINNGVLSINGLPSNSMITYYVSVMGAGICENLPGNLASATVTVNTAETPTTTNSTQTFCADSNATIADIQVNETNIIWYDAATGGNVLNSSTVLANNQMYYAAQVVGTCESITRLAVTTILTTPGTPTGDAAQAFCASTNPTIMDIMLNETDVLWYDEATGGNMLDASTSLVNGETYYAALLVGTCEGQTRFAVTVSVTSPVAPTTTNANQAFCAGGTIADLQVNEANVVWYDAATGGTAYANTDALVNGQTYYGAQIVSGCESTDRLAITVMVDDGLPPTITPDISGPACVSTPVTYSTESGMSNYNWQVNGGTIVAGGTTSDNFVTVTWTTDQNTSVTVSYDNVTPCAGTETATLDVQVTTCSDLKIAITVDNTTPLVGNLVKFTVTVDNEGTTDFTNVKVDNMLPDGYDYISHLASRGGYDPITGVWSIQSFPNSVNAKLEVTAEVKANNAYLNVAEITASDPLDSDLTNNRAEVTVVATCLLVYNEFSPNNDGKNDTFTINCIENYPNNTLKVYNRYGNLVYEKHGYDNTWTGIANQDVAFSSNRELPVGTYYYVFDPGDGSAILKGWLYINR
ncbi:gliding motility-associated C-terminal domain-containing protein, partial [Zhouia sp. PK063]|uniref:Ig-like domain-containing protein n=1 Tax=Zhouia sp. PK063 TaxID=3373602 RepID=UPI0037A375D8